MKTILVDAWGTLFLEHGISEHMYELLEKYPNPKIVVTNANDEQRVQYGIDKSPYEVFSLKHNPDKIDSLYFRLLLKKYALKAHDAIYIEHDIKAVRSARSSGIKSLKYDNERMDLADVKQFIDENL